MNILDKVLKPIKSTCIMLSKSQRFDNFVVLLIIINAITIGLETYPSLNHLYGDLFHAFNNFVLVVFIIEAIVKMAAVSPHIEKYFKSGWNVFDFLIIVLAFVPAVGSLATIGRLARILRVLRLVTKLKELRMIVATLLRSIPSIANVLLLLNLIFYIYAIMGIHFFREIDPEHWSSLGVAMITLFRMATLEDWTDIMYTAMQHYPSAWIFFISFIIVAGLMVVNLFIGVVLLNISDVKKEQLKRRGERVSNSELLHELKSIEESLAEIKKGVHLDEEPQKSH